MKRAALLFAVLPALAFAQLPPSTTWKYSVVSGGGHSARFLLFLESDQPATRKAREWWTVETSAPADDGSLTLTRTIRTAEGNAKQRFKTWLSGQTVMGVADGEPPERAVPLVTREGPPRPLSLERVPCRAPFFGISATCAGHAGGPLQQPELPLQVLVRGDTNRFGRELASFGAFLLTGGVLLPGTENRSIVATLEPSAPKLPPMLARWRKGAHTHAALATLGLAEEEDVETLGALLVLGGTPDLEVVRALTRHAPALDRWPLVRLARQSGADERFVVRLVARLLDDAALSAPTDAEQRALQASALVELDPKLSGAIDAMLNGGMPTLRVVAASSKQLDVDAARALETATLVPGEALPISLLMTKPALNKALPRFIERLPDAEGLELVDALVRHDADARRLETLKRLPTWVDRVLRGEHGVALLKSLSFDEQRVTLLQAAWKRAPTDERLPLLRIALAGMDDDKARRKLLTAWVPQLPLSAPQRLEVLDAFTSDAGRDATARQLMTGLDAGERASLVMRLIKSTSAPRNRVRLLQEFAPPMMVDDARALIDVGPFDSDRMPVAIALLPLVPEAQRGEFFVKCMKSMRFDAGRLELLQSPARPSLTPEEVQRVVDAFVFEKERAWRLLH